jgi:hypothetical protein
MALFNINWGNNKLKNNKMISLIDIICCRTKIEWEKNKEN